MSKRLVFFGNERLVSGLKRSTTPVLNGLIEAGYEIVAVVVNHEAGISRNSRELEVAQVAKAHKIPVFSPNNPRDIEEDLRYLTPDAAVLVAYGKIIPERIINLFDPIGIINIHPSLLPRHRGPTPIESTILDGDTKAGVSIIQLDSGMDTGPVYGQVEVALSGKETKFELHDMLTLAGSSLLLNLLPTILENELTPKPQKNYDVSVTSLISKQDGILDPKTDDAYVLERKVRAYLGYPKSRLHVGDNDVIVTSAKVADSLSPEKLVIRCLGDTYLEIAELIAPSGKTMSGEAYVRGYAA